MLKKLLGGVLIAVALATNPAALGQDRQYILATASTGGTFYPVGVALATLVKTKLQTSNGIALSAISSAGSNENIRLLAKNEAQLAILQGLYGYYAATGSGPMQKAGKQTNLRSISTLWQNVEHFLIDSRYAKTGTVEDLRDVKGKRMAMGKRNSGTIGSNEALLQGLGIDIKKDYRLMYGGYEPSADALQNAQVAGASIAAGVPVGAVSKLFATVGDKVTLLDVSDAQLEKMDAGRNLWTRFIIPAGTYISVDRKVHTIAQPNFLAVLADMPENDVYQLTKSIYENLPFLRNIHPATKAMTLKKAITGLPLPLHPGAVKYYREQGIDIPEHLIAEHARE